MKTELRRLVVCEKCGTKYAFIVPEKPGIYRIQCPGCKEETKFKVVTNKL